MAGSGKLPPATTPPPPRCHHAADTASQIFVMEGQSYFDLLQSDVGLHDLHWTEEEQIDLEKNGEKQTDLEGPEELTPPMTARSLKAKAKKARASKSSPSKRQKNFSKADDLTLVDVYLEITQDPIIGVDQSRDCYWKRIDAYFHANKSEDHGRTQGSLQHRWAIIQEQVNRFCACYSQVLNRNQSAMTRDNKLCQALVLYANGDKANKTFGLIHCFNKLEDTEKWKCRPQKKQKTSSLDTPDSSSASVFENEATSPSKVVPMKRPPGIKRAEESKIMSMDLSGMDEQEQEFYKLRKSQIINQHRNSSA